jgi:chorismate mutase
MKTNLQIFKNSQFGEVRVTEQELERIATENGVNPDKLTEILLSIEKYGLYLTNELIDDILSNPETSREKVINLCKTP